MVTCKHFIFFLDDLHNVEPVAFIPCAFAFAYVRCPSSLKLPLPDILFTHVIDGFDTLTAAFPTFTGREYAAAVGVYRSPDFARIHPDLVRIHQGSISFWQTGVN